MSVELKIKSKHLSEEAKIIRFEEHKLKKQSRYLREQQDTVSADRVMTTWHSLNTHRRWDVRNENRATFLARAFIAGKSYKSVENKRSEDSEYIFVNYILPRVLTMVNKYGIKDVTKEDIIEWSKLD